MSNTQQVKVKISDVIDMLENGKTREDIGNHYGLDAINVKRLFEHEDLKGKRTKKAPAFVIVDEEENDLSQLEIEEVTNMDDSPELADVITGESNRDTTDFSDVG